MQAKTQQHDEKQGRRRRKRMSMKDEEKVNKLRDKISRIKRDGLEEYEVRPCYRSSDIGHLGCVVRVEEQEREKKKKKTKTREKERVVDEGH